MNAGSSATDIRNRLLSTFEQARQSPGAFYQPDRLLAFLTDPPAPEGRRVADTFAGRRRFVRFMNTIQLESGICFTLEEWARGFSLEDLAKLVAAKIAKPDQGLRLAKQRLDQARRRRVVDPVRFGLLTLPILVVAGLVDSWPAQDCLCTRVGWNDCWGRGILLLGGPLQQSAGESYRRRAEQERVAGS